jgi:hypothetical protein
LKIAIEIVDLPTKNGDFNSYVSLPEGNIYLFSKIYGKANVNISG